METTAKSPAQIVTEYLYELAEMITRILAQKNTAASVFQVNIAESNNNNIFYLLDEIKYKMYIYFHGHICHSLFDQVFERICKTDEVFASVQNYVNEQGKVISVYETNEHVLHYYVTEIMLLAYLLKQTQ